MKRRRKCRHCHELFLPDPRSYSKTRNGRKVSVQHYCSHPDCQKESQRQSHKAHVRRNPRYRQKMLKAARRWRKKKQGYWQDRRKKEARVVTRNLLLQKQRDAKGKGDLANINSIKSLCIEKLHRISILVDLANINSREVSWIDVSEEILAYLRWFSRLANIKAIGKLKIDRHNLSHETAL